MGLLCNGKAHAFRDAGIEIVTRPLALNLDSFASLQPA